MAATERIPVLVTTAEKGSIAKQSKASGVSNYANDSLPLRQQQELRRVLRTLFG